MPCNQSSDTLKCAGIRYERVVVTIPRPTDSRVLLIDGELYIRYLLGEAADAYCQSRYGRHSFVIYDIPNPCEKATEAGPNDDDFDRLALVNTELP